MCFNLVVEFFSFTVTSVIMQKNGAGLHTASSCYWDNSTDGRSMLLLNTVCILIVHLMLCV